MPKATTKKIETKEDKLVLFEYDMNLEQKIPLELTKNNKTYRLYHVLKPLSDDRYLRLERAREDARKTTRGETNLLKPVFELWDELIIERIGYKESDDIRRDTNIMDKTRAVFGLLFAKPSSEDESESIIDTEAEPDELFDDTELNKVSLDVVQSGVAITTEHYFRAATQDEMDEYLSIISGMPSPKALASAKKPQLKQKRAIDLYDLTIDHVDGYASEVPAWHKPTAVLSFFTELLNRMNG